MRSWTIIVLETPRHIWLIRSGRPMTRAGRPLANAGPLISPGLCVLYLHIPLLNDQMSGRIMGAVINQSTPFHIRLRPWPCLFSLLFILSPPSLPSLSPHTICFSLSLVESFLPLPQSFFNSFSANLFRSHSFGTHDYITKIITYSNDS